MDSTIDFPGNDQEQMDRVLGQVHAQLMAAQQDHKRVILLTHFAPRHELLAPKPATVNTP